MNDSGIYDEYERLWRCYSVCCHSADALKSPNPHDDEFIKMAIVGFSYHDKTENWKQCHFDLAKAYLDESLRLGDTVKTAKFSLLALGALLGLYSSGKIDERHYGIGYALLPGFVMSKGGEIEML